MSMYLHSLVRWYFDGAAKAAAPTAYPAHPAPKRWARTEASVAARQATLAGEAVAVGCSGGEAPWAPNRTVLEPPAPRGKPGAGFRVLPPGAPERDEASERVPSTPRLPTATELGPRPAQTSRPLRYMRSPHQLGLDAPGLLEAYDGHFDEQGDNLFSADGCVLTGQFFVDVGLLEQAAEAQRLADGLWTRAAGPEVFRALADAELPTLQQRVACAAELGQVPLDAAQVLRAAKLLRLHGLEACRIELYTQLLLECQAFSRQFSSFFSTDDVVRARGLLDGLNLTEVADQFLGEPDAPPAFGPAYTREEALAQFDHVLATFCAWLQEARVYPSERALGTFYPASPTYAGPAEAAPPPYPG